MFGVSYFSTSAFGGLPAIHLVQSVTGQAVGSVEGTVTNNVETVSVTGVQAAFTQGSVTVNTEFKFEVTGVSLEGIVNNLVPQVNLGAGVSVSGSSIVSDVTAPNVYEDLSAEIDTEVTTNWVDIFSTSFTGRTAPYSGSTFSDIGFSSARTEEENFITLPPDASWSEIDDVSTTWEEIP